MPNHAHVCIQGLHRGVCCELSFWSWSCAWPFAACSYSSGASSDAATADPDPACSHSAGPDPDARTGHLFGRVRAVRG